MPKQGSRSQAVARFTKAGGLLRAHQALKAGIHPRTLYQFRDEGFLEQVSRGVYRLADLPPLEEPDLVLIASRVPRAVICLVSALHYRGLTLEIPHEVGIALPPGMKAPLTRTPAHSRLPPSPPRPSPPSNPAPCCLCFSELGY
jgi:hypothetical protein